ncbi:hypothetical protein A4X03_0g7786 [Tilletia caries]|uniref:Reverse transcriptase domain-containing protein n=1 Tax=Tilletia caries TaxID=13290 RepID=A0A8T8SLA3_9BASI|nr:hypothetical protein A4X03_0g7786 [Tilletia caries]
MSAKYSALLRQHYYNSTIGSTRPNPSLFQPEIWKHVVAVRQGNEWEGYLSPEPTHGILGALSSSAPGPSRAHHRSAGRGQYPAPGRPFRASSQGVSRTASGACFICGRTKSEAPHDFATCKSPAAGRTTPFAYRNAHGHLLRVSDNSPMELSSVGLLHRLRPELSGSARPLNAEGFESVLESLNLLDDFGDLLAGLRDGFDFGIPPLRETRTPPNHVSASANSEALQIIAEKEMTRGRWAGPYDRARVESEIGPFQTSPLGLLPKSNGSWRLVQDLSYPRDGSYDSINKFIISDEFLTTWDNVSEVFAAMLELGSGVEGATFDAMEAFRGILASRSQLPGLVIQLQEGVFYIDFFLPFGLVSATGVWGRVADCVKAIIMARLLRRVRIFRWVDDFLVLRLDPSVTAEEVIAATEGLNFPWNRAKTVDFCPCPKYVGWVFNISDRKHVAFVARDLRPFLGKLGLFIAHWPEGKSFQKRVVQPEVRRECDLWLTALAQVPFVRSFAPPPRDFDQTVWVDASTEWGVGVVVGDAWAAWRWHEGWQRDGRGIGWGEAVALELGMLAAISQGAQGSRITFRSDNQGVIACYKLGRSRSRQINTVLKRVVALERDHNGPVSNLSKFPHLCLPISMLFPSIDYVLKEHRRLNAGRGKVQLGSFGGGTDADMNIPSAFPPPLGPSVFSSDEASLRLSLFPNVPASERLLKWRPGLAPSPTLLLSSGSPLPASTHLNLIVAHTLQAALEPSTRTNCGHSLGVFLRFCFDLGLSVRQVFPISEGLLLAFVCAQAGSRSRKTVGNHLAALAAWHETWGVQWRRFDLIDRALQGVGKLAPAKLPLRPPVELADLFSARLFLDPTNNPLHAAVWACALMSFWSACRLGETTVPSATYFNPARHVTRSAVGPVQTLPSGAQALGVHLPWTKTTRAEGMTKVLSSQAAELDPIQALLWHLSLNSVPSLNSALTPLFAYKVRAGSGFRLTPLSKVAMLNTFAEALRQAGRPSFSGHSFRIGAATYYWHAGASVEEIKLLGGWASDSFKVYLRDPVRGLAPLQQRLGPAAAQNRAPS